VPIVQVQAVANFNDPASPRCGACRQVLAGFTLPEAPVIFDGANGARTLAFSELLPESFSL
jgi:cytidine deaminase